MADTNEKTVESPTKGTSSEANFMMECLKHLQNPATVDVNAVADALGYKNPASVGNRIRALKKKFDLQIALSNGSSNAGGENGSPARKGAKAARGPIKAKAETETANGENGKPADAKPKAKSGRKPKGTSAKGKKEVFQEKSKDEPEPEKEDSGDGADKSNSEGA